MSFRKTAGMTRFAHRVPKLRRRSWADAVLPSAGLTTTLAVWPIFVTGLPCGGPVEATHPKAPEPFKKQLLDTF
jgi:hypothetical protein